MRSVCTSAKLKLEDIKKSYEERKQKGVFSDTEFETNKKQISEMEKIIHFCSCGSHLEDGDHCEECEKVASTLLSLGYSNRFLFISFFFNEVKEFLKEEIARTKFQIDDNKDDAQYVVGKIYLFGRFEEKIKKLEEENKAEYDAAEIFSEKTFSTSEEPKN